MQPILVFKASICDLENATDVSVLEMLCREFDFAARLEEISSFLVRRPRANLRYDRRPAAGDSHAGGRVCSALSSLTDQSDGQAVEIGQLRNSNGGTMRDIGGLWRHPVELCRSLVR
jgi:hypothetical protein